MEQLTINVASKESTSGHYAINPKKVIMVDEINETSLIRGDCVLSTKNHTDLNMKSDCLITIQQVYDPFAKMFQKSRD